MNFHRSLIQNLKPERPTTRRGAGKLPNRLKPELQTGGVSRCDRGEGAFTMIEIALSIAVVAFALVAILGVLPTGMTVQRDNRDDTIVNQEGRFWLEAIRGGARGLDDITNYVEEIRINSTPPVRPVVVVLTNRQTALTASNIIGLLSTPKYVYIRTNGEPDLLRHQLVTNILARVKSLTGSAAEKGALTNDTSFRYQMQVEMIPDSTLPLELEQQFLGLERLSNIVSGSSLRARRLALQSHELRLTIRWPLYERGTNWSVGNGRRVFRTKIAGSLVPVPSEEFPDLPPLYFMRPSIF